DNHYKCGRNWKSEVPKVNRQANAYECGDFTLARVHKILMNDEAAILNGSDSVIGLRGKVIVELLRTTAMGKQVLAKFGESMPKFLEFLFAIGLRQVDPVARPSKEKKGKPASAFTGQLCKDEPEQADATDVLSSNVVISSMQELVFDPVMFKVEWAEGRLRNIASLCEGSSADDVVVNGFAHFLMQAHGNGAVFVPSVGFIRVSVSSCNNALCNVVLN